METNKPKNDDVLTVSECRKYLEKYNLSDEQVEGIRDNLIGIINSVFNSYLEEFK